MDGAWIEHLGVESFLLLSLSLGVFGLVVVLLH